MYVDQSDVRSLTAIQSITWPHYSKSKQPIKTMSRSNTGVRSRSGSTSNPGSGSRRNAESSSSVGGPRTMASPDESDTQLHLYWAFVKPKKTNDEYMFAITLYYPAHKRFSKLTPVNYLRSYFVAQTKTLVIEVNPNWIWLQYVVFEVCCIFCIKTFFYIFT